MEVGNAMQDSDLALPFNIDADKLGTLTELPFQVGKRTAHTSLLVSVLASMAAATYKCTVSNGNVIICIGT